MAAISSFGVTVNSRRCVDASPSYYENHLLLQVGDGTSTYPTGGIALTPAQASFSTAIFFTIPIDINIGGGYVPKWNTATGKLQFFDNVGVEMLGTVTPNSTLNILVRGY